MHTWLQDLRHTARRLLLARGFALVAVASLALGIGSAAVIFSLVRGAVWKPLAYREPARLVFVREVVPRLQAVYPTLPVNLRHFQLWREQARSFDGLAAFVAGAVTLTGAATADAPGAAAPPTSPAAPAARTRSAAAPAAPAPTTATPPIPEVIDCAETTANLFALLGVQPRLGRSFLPGEEQPGRNRVVVMTDRLWRRRFGAAPGLVGRAIDLDGVPHTVVGILPPSFRFPHKDDLGALAALGERIEIFRPLGETLGGWGGDFDYSVFARLRPGATPAAARAELDLLAARIVHARQLPPGLRTVVLPLQEVIAGSARGGLYALLAGVGLLVVLVSVNLANLVLARSAGRARELAVRLALGASRASLVRGVCAETLLLAAAGGAAGTLAAAAALSAFTAAAPIDLPRLDEVALDLPVLLFALALSAGCGLLAGLLPARRVAAADAQATLRAESRTATGSRSALRLRGLLVGSEVALSTLLLVLAALLAGSLFRLLRVDRGFDASRALAVRLSARPLPAAERTAAYERALDAVRALPGVRAAAFVSRLPLTGESNVNHVQLEGADQDATEPGTRDAIEINVRFVGAGYFATLGIPLLRGRPLEAADRDRPVAVVSARLAAKLWPGRDPLGRRFSTGSGVGTVEVVGVVQDVHGSRLERGTTLMAYTPYWRRGLAVGELAVRTVLAPSALAGPLRRRIAETAPALAVERLRPLTELVSEAVAQRRFQLLLAAGFALAALLLAALGIYGVVSYGVAQRRREIGVRMALGARLPALLGLVLGSGLRPVLLGLAAGLAGAAACGRLVEALLFGTRATDPWALAAVAFMLTAVAAAACLLPALDAARTDPAGVLREG
jgi:predicted permease